ncbi:MAG: zinc ABC transporter substrate-binding protein [Xanthobacteraceae bacterium]
MRTTIGLVTALLCTLAVLSGASAVGGKIAVVAAENFYGGVAQQIGGDEVSVLSIMSNPDQDPHLFETTPSVVRDIAAAQLVIYNGADYDSWMAKLLTATPRLERTVIVAAELVHTKVGDNPHLWYDPSTMPAVATALATAFTAVDPIHNDDYSARLKTFLASLEPLQQKIAALRSKYAGVPVTASEPVFGYMATALGLEMRNQDFQLAVMNDTEPSASEVAAFESDLKTHKVKVMFYNKQASDDLVTHLVALARASHIPVVGVTETCPPGMSYQDWMMSEVDNAAKALAGPSS